MRLTKHIAYLGLAFAALAAPGILQAQIRLLGIGVLAGNADLSGLTGTLENGDPANVLGGTGSGLTYAGGTSFLALADRGPNAKPYNPAVDNTTSYIARFHTISVSLSPAAAGARLPFDVRPTLEGTTLLFSPTPLAYGDGKAAKLNGGAPAANRPGRFFFTGRSDNFAQGEPSAFPGHGRFDPEGIRLGNDGSSLFVSDEYGPSLYRFDRHSGKRLASFALPAKFAVARLSSNGDAEKADNMRGRTANKGMEGLAITPDGTMLVGIMQAALRQDAAVPETKKLLRIVTIEIATGKVHEYGYMLTEGSGVSEILAINGHDFLVLERDGGGLGEDKPVAVTKKLFRIDLTGVRDIGDLQGADAAAVAVPKREVLDIVHALTANGMAADKIPGKLEGLAFGPDQIADGQTLHTLYLANDNDFVPGQAGPNMIFVFGFADADIPALVKQPL